MAPEDTTHLKRWGIISFNMGMTDMIRYILLFIVSVILYAITHVIATTPSDRIVLVRLIIMTTIAFALFGVYVVFSFYKTFLKIEESNLELKLAINSMKDKLPKA